MAENDAAMLAELKKITLLLNATRSEQGKASIFNEDLVAKQIEKLRDEQGRASEAQLKKMQDITNDTSADTKRYQKMLDDAIKKNGVKTIESIKSVSDVLKAQDQSKLLEMMSTKLSGYVGHQFDTQEAAQAEFDKLQEMASTAGVSLEELGLKIKETHTFGKGGAKEIKYRFDNVAKVAGVVHEEFTKLDQSIKESIDAHNEHTRKLNTVKNLLGKFGNVVKGLAKEFVRLGEDEARFAQQSATADAGFIDGMYRMGISQIEYMKILKDTRVESLAMQSAGLDFKDSLEASKESLNGLTKNYGEAAIVAAKFHKNVAGFGVSQQNLGDAVAQQTSIYEKNYRALGYTAEQFADLSSEMINSQEMRSTLLGLQEKERKQYVLGIQQRMAEYQTMGYTIERAKELQKTFQALNKMNPKDRMKQAAKQRAMMGAMGMGREGEELFKLQTQYRTMSAEEKLIADKRMTEIQQQAAGKFGEMSGSGASLGQSFAMQTMADKTGMTEVFDKFEAESIKGREIDEELLAKTSEIPKLLSELLGVMSGFEGMKGSAFGSLATGVMGAGGAMGASFLGKKLVGGISGMFGGGPDGATSNTKPSMVDKAKNLGGKGKTLLGRGAGLMKGAALPALAATVGWEVGTAIGDQITDIWKSNDQESYGDFAQVLGGTFDTFLASWGNDAAQDRLDTNMQMKMQQRVDEMNTQKQADAVKKEETVTKETGDQLKSKNEKDERLVTVLESILSFLQMNGEMTSSQADALHKVAKGMNDQKRMDSLPGARTVG